jgi:hypothetical protein
MALHSQFHMPGTFQSDGVHPDIFRTPAKSPCSASSSGYLPSRAGIEEETSTKRKRHHGDGYSARIRTQSQSLAQTATARFNNPFLAATHPEPRTYTLAGHIHTPTTEYNDGNTPMADSVYSDSDYRKMLGTKRPRDDLDANNVPVFPTQPIQQQQYLDQQQQLAQSQGWGAFAFSTLGDVVGRLWQFCKAGSFKGFHAGGGRGYEMNGQADEIVPMTPNEPNNFQHQAEHLFDARFSRATARDYADNNNDADSRSSSPAAPAAKRRQTGPADELNRNWVMIGKSGTPASTPRASIHTQQRQTPRNRNHGPSAATGRRISTPTSRRSTIGLGPLNTAVPTLAESRPASTASYASPRSPSPTKIPNPTPSASFSIPRNHSSRRPRSQTGVVVTTPSHRRTNSAASIASPRGTSFNQGANGSPRLTVEARQLAARRKQEDDETDFRIEAFNKQLQDMIRQGKEALGTTIEVEGDGDCGGGGGWEDYP